MTPALGLLLQDASGVETFLGGAVAVVIIWLLVKMITKDVD